MDERTERRLLEKAGYVTEAIGVLVEKREALTFDQYTNSREQRDIVEREFETAIQAAIDIGKMLLRSRNHPVPETNAEIFHTLHDEGILEAETARRMARAAGFRNILAHTYGTEIDDEDVYNALQMDLPVFRDFLSQVRASFPES